MKRSILYKINYLLDYQQKKIFFFLVVLTLIGGFLEYVGFAALLPALIIITKNNYINIDNFLVSSFINFISSNKNKEIFILIIFLSVYLIKLLILTLIVLIQNKFLLEVKLKLSNILASDYLNGTLLAHVKKKPEKLIANLTEEIAGVGHIFLQISTIFTDILLILSAVFFITLIDYKVALFFYLILILILITYQFSVKKTIKMKAVDRLEHNMNRLEIINYFFNGFKEIKLFKKEKFFLEKLNFSSKKNFNSLARINIIQSLPRIIVDLIFVLLIFFFLFFIFYNNLNFQQYLPLFGIYMFAAIRVIPSLIKASSSINQINFCLPSLDVIFDEVNLIKNTIANHPNINKSNTFFFKNEIRVNNLNFSYSDKPIIKNLNFRIKKNQITIIAGRSGSGKTTLINILTGLLEVKKNLILIDNVDINDILYQWQLRLGYIPQDIYLLNSSIKENISFGENQEKIDENKIIDIIKVLNFDKFINDLNDGINTIAGHSGKMLSGGQIQKVAIARALYKNSDVLFFDEPTSNLDKESVDEFIKTIERLKENKTIIVVSHDQSIINKFSNVIFLD